MSLPLLYEKPVALDSKIHLNLRIRPLDEGLRFTAKINSVLLAGTEFPEACKHLPIVFAKTADGPLVATALLGFREQENLFVDAEGRWKAGYVPAYIRRYPFVLANTEENGRFNVCIDESYAGFGADEGVPLFNGKGEPTEFLQGALSFLQDFHAQLERTDAFLRTLAALDLLKDVSANVNLPDGQRYSMTGLTMVDEEKLLALPAERILQLFRSGELAWIYSHLISIANFRYFPDKVPAPRPASTTPPPAPAAKTAAPAKPAPATKPARRK